MLRLDGPLYKGAMLFFVFSNQTLTPIPIPQYSMYGHIHKLAEAEKAGIEAAGGTCDLFQ